MPNFMLAYYGGNKPGSQEEGMAQMEKWKGWIEGLGESIVNPGTPLPVSKIVKSGSVEGDTDENAMKGFAVVKAESMAAAVEIAQSDPFLENGGTIRVSQMMEMNEQGSC
ncbi:MAG: YciI family protein [Nitrospira sp.]|nr:YciI family protein [Nitrospira sp.]